MGLFDKMKEFEKAQEEHHVRATFSHSEEKGVGVKCSVNATAKEVRALIASLAMQICDRENMSATEFFAEMSLTTMMQQESERRNKNDE